MTSSLFGSLAVVCYLCGAILQYFTLTRPKKIGPPYALIMGALAVFFHTLSFHGTLLTDSGLDVGLYNISSLIDWLIVIIVITSSMRKPLENLFIGIYPLAALSIVLAIVNQDSTQPLVHFSFQMSSHIILSVVSYSVLTIAAVQSIILAIQDHHLHHKITNSLIMNLPPLQVMEKLLFEVIWVGFILLTTAIVTGFVFIEDIFAQHLVHKTVLSLIAWSIYSILLLGRYRLGWRGTTAIRYTLAGYTLLMLAFIGTKLVLEVILQRAG